MTDTKKYTAFVVAHGKTYTLHSNSHLVASQWIHSNALEGQKYGIIRNDA